MLSECGFCCYWSNHSYLFHRLPFLFYISYLISIHFLSWKVNLNIPPHSGSILAVETQRGEGRICVSWGGFPAGPWSPQTHKVQPCEITFNEAFCPGSLQTQKIQPSKVTLTFIVWSFQLEHKKSSYVLSCQQCWPNNPSQVPWRRLYLRRCWSSCGRMPKAKIFAQNNPRGESEMIKLPFFWMSHLSQGNLLIRANQGHSISTVEVTSSQLKTQK